MELTPFEEYSSIGSSNYQIYQTFSGFIIVGTGLASHPIRSLACLNPLSAMVRDGSYASEGNRQSTDVTIQM